MPRRTLPVSLAPQMSPATHIPKMKTNKPAMSRETTDTSAGPSESEFISTRVFAAPRERLFEAFSNPDHLVHWWGPEGFRNTFQEFDLRPGGAWRFVMHGPDGTDYPLTKRFVEIVAPERIVLQHAQPMHNFQMTMTYAEHPDGTHLTWRMLFEPSPHNANLKDFIPAANEQNFDRLRAYLDKLPPR